ncbi:MAG TPA: glycosyltransferase [Alphaproteobacteria bacterium]|nr:glycosyltransferase [Alphaproteobacteria bacterium]
MARIRVLQVMAGARHGGAEAFFTRLVPALASAGLEQRVVIRRDAERAAKLRKEGLEPLELPFRPFLDLGTHLALKRAVKEFAPQIVLTWMNRASAVCPRGRFVHAARLGGYYDLRYYRKSQHLIGNTVDIVAYLRRSGWPAERTHYLPNFVDTEPASPVARASLGTPEGAPVLLALGRLHSDKAFDVLLDALAALEGVHCWLAGEGPERAALEAQAARRGLGERLHFLGWREDVGALFAAADLLVCPSRIEPLGNVVIEAWARKVPIVAGASAGPKGLIADGENGLLVPLEDAGALAGAIRRVLEDGELARRLVAGGSAAHEKSFTKPAVVARYMEFFEKVAA